MDFQVKGFVGNGLMLLFLLFVICEVFVVVVGLLVDVICCQCDCGYWLCIIVGKYSLINVEVICVQVVECGWEFFL